jgi:major membrane immunogen (membrane-anchored lipoprotein)
MLVILMVVFAGFPLFAQGDQDVDPEQVEPEDVTLADGIYFAQEDGFSERTGWKYMVTLEVKDDKIVSAEWNGAHREAGTDKRYRSESGAYGMVEKGDAQSKWIEQAKRTEEWLLETQDPTDITYTNDAGNTDAISGVTIHVKEFFDLAVDALEAGPAGYGMYEDPEDGEYYAEADQFSEQGWKSTVSLTVVSGRIVSAWWDAVPEEGGDTKKVQSKNGDYGMVANSDAQWPWHEQAANAEMWLIENQDPTKISFDSEGNTDAISGVSIHVNDLFNLAQEALDGNKR